MFSKLLKLVTDRNYRSHHWQMRALTAEMKRLRHSPRYTPDVTRYKDFDIEIADSASYLFLLEELFQKKCYRFHTENPTPVIIDAGANIGLSTLFFKTHYPGSHVIAFEPDREMFAIMQRNLARWKFEGVELHELALWNEEGDLTFYSEGSDSGRLGYNAQATPYKVKTALLSRYLSQPVDLLKIDIEGSESYVLEECAHMLHNVRRVFVEYHSFVNTPQHMAIVVEILETAGYRLYFNTPGLFSHNPFMYQAIEKDMDGQLNIYAVREVGHFATE